MKNGGTWSIFSLQKQCYPNKRLLQASVSAYKPSEQIDTALRTVRKFIKNPDINRISNITTISSFISLRTIQKCSNRILIQTSPYSFFEACDSSQDYPEESTGETTRMTHSQRVCKISAPNSVSCSMS